jgi:hypothetical protein
LEKSRLYLGLELQNRGGVFGIIAAITFTHAVPARFLMCGGTCAQNFAPPANHGTPSAWTDHVTLPDSKHTVSTSSACRRTRPQPLSVMGLRAIIGLSHGLPDFPRSPRQQPFHVNPSLKSHTIVVF